MHYLKILNPLIFSNLEQINITFYEMFCHKYFATVKATLKKHALINYIWAAGFRPEKHKHKYNVGIGAKYIDIILTFNQYDTELTNPCIPFKTRN